MTNDKKIADKSGWLDKLLSKAQDATDVISGRELDFVSSLTDRFERFRADTYVSEKQMRWLRQIETKIEAAQ